MTERVRRTQIIDERQEANKRIRLNLMARDPSLAEYNQCVSAVCRLSCEIFLRPEFVVLTTDYWLTHYSNYFVDEKDWFNELITNLVQRPVNLQLQVSELGTPAITESAIRTPRLLAFAGSRTQSVPLAYYVSHLCHELMASLALLVPPQRGAFAMRTTASLTGELELGACLYNGLMEYFYEPCFFITTAYMLHLAALLHTTESRSGADWLSRHIYSLKAIDTNAPEWQSGCFTTSAVTDFKLGNAEERGEQLKRDLAELYDILNTSEGQVALDAVRNLWQKKASHYWLERDRRCRVIFSRLA